MRWMRLYLAGVAFFYPFLWTSLFLLLAFPGLVRVAFFGHQLRSFHVSYFEAVALTRSPEASTGEERRPSRFGSLTAGGEWLAVVCAVVLLLGLRKGRRRLLAGLAAALFTSTALLLFLADLFFRHRSRNAEVFAAVICLALLCIAIRWMIGAAGAANFRARLAVPLLALALPMATVWLVFFVFLRFRAGTLFFLELGPVVLGSLVASLRPITPAQEAPSPAGWEVIGFGVTATLVLVAGIHSATQALADSRVRSSRAALLALPEIPHELPYDKTFFQKGVNFTSEFPEVYGSEGARMMLGQLPAYGVNAIALVPYGFTNLKSPRVRGWNTDWESDDGLRQLSRVAHSLGVKVLLKPQLWMQGGNPAAVEYASAEDRAKWFAEYGQFLEHYARLATEIHADVFCVGVELGKMTLYDGEWRTLIGRTREFYPGPLVYAANFGDDFEHVTFWDALDYIGLDEYYPLPDNLSTDEVLGKVEAVQRKYGKPVVFTEAGVASTEASYRKPWDDPAGKVSLEQQAQYYEALLRAFYDKPWFMGVYWWKVGTNGFGGPEDTSHTPWRKPAMDVVKRWYLQGGR